MKQLRWLWVALALIGLAFALRAGLVAFAGYVLLGVYLVSRYLAREWVANLSATRTATVVPLEVGQTLLAQLVIENGGKLPVGWVLVEDLVPAFALRPPTPRVKVEGKRVQVLTLPAGGSRTVKLKYTFNARGYYPIGPMLAETGDVFGLHRRHRLLAPAVYQLVLPRIIPIPGYDFSSRRPVGEVRLANRLFEDPTRTAGVRPYQLGDPFAARPLARHRPHGRAALARLRADLGSPARRYSSTSTRRVTPSATSRGARTSPSPARAPSPTPCRCRISNSGWRATAATPPSASAKRRSPRTSPAAKDSARGPRARAAFEPPPEADRLRPVVVETRRGFDQFQMVREALARLEVNDGQSFATMLVNVLPRLPRDATLIAILSLATVETAVALGIARRQGFAVSALVVGHAPGSEEQVAAAGPAGRGGRPRRALRGGRTGVGRARRARRGAGRVRLRRGAGVNPLTAGR